MSSLLTREEGNPKRTDVVPGQLKVADTDQHMSQEWLGEPSDARTYKVPADRETRQQNKEN